MTISAQSRKKQYIELIIASLILLFCECFFFRNVLTGDALFGDRGDGRLTTLLTEHWWNFFNGKERFTELAMFYPTSEAIGYTDLLFGYGLIHSVYRLFGMSMYLAYKWTIITVHAMGTVSMYYLMRRKLKCNTRWSLFATMAFSFSDTFARHLCHTQLAAVSALPILLILFLGFVENYRSRKKRNIYAYGFLAWFVLLTYNSWYVACFTGVFGIVFLIVYAIQLKLRREKPLSLLKEFIFPLWKDLLGYLLFTIILYIPFLMIYYPVMRASSGYWYFDCAVYLPEFADIFNVSTQNLLLGKIIAKSGLPERDYSMEVEMGFSVILLGLFIIFFLIEKKRNQLDLGRYPNDKHDCVMSTVIPSTVFVTVIVCILLTLRLSANGMSLWIAVYYLLPVVRSMRAVARFLLWLSFPMAVVTAFCADKYFRSLKPLIRILLTSLAIILLFFSNINTVGVSQAWTESEEVAFLDSICEPPEDAEVFYVIDTADSDRTPTIYQLEAYEIANYYSLKTINGFSGQFPADWSGIWDVTGESYRESVDAWIQKHNLSDVYAYDLATDCWIPHQEVDLLKQ